MKPKLFALSLVLTGTLLRAAGAEADASAEASKTPDTSHDAAAFQEITRAAKANNKGVVVSDKDLSAKDKEWNEDVGRTSLKVADLAAKFLTNYPSSKHAGDALGVEEQMLNKAAYAGAPGARERVEALANEKLKDPALGENDRYHLRSMVLWVGMADAKTAAERAVVQEGIARQLLKEFPKRPEPYSMLLQSAKKLEPAKSRALVEELAAMPGASDEMKQRAKGALRQMDALGHPPEIAFTAVDGRQVDLAKYKGKVVLLDFWATWCGPCVGEIPHVKEAYEKLHDRGFEIVGISFDSNKSALEKFVASHQMPWPQYFDGNQWSNEFGVYYGIDSIPRMWLVGRDGNIADIEARSDLAGKVEKLLGNSEKSTAAN